MNQLELLYIHTSKGHKETPWAAILNKKKKNVIFFFSYKIKEQEGRTDLPWEAFCLIDSFVCFSFGFDFIKFGPYFYLFLSFCLFWVFLVLVFLGV
jgi:hypothetical protein